MTALLRAISVQLSAIGLLIFLFVPNTVYAVDIPSEGAGGSSVARGVQINDTEALARLLTSGINFDWVKFQYAPGDTGIKAKVGAAKLAGKKVMVSVAKNHTGAGLPAGEPQGDQCPDGATDASDGYIAFRQFMEKTAKELGADAYELWNEPNLKDGEKYVEWDEAKMGAYSTVKYTKLLECGAKGVKAGDSRAKVISAGFSPNGDPKDIDAVSLMMATISDEALANVDFVGAHLYSGDTTSPDTSPAFNSIQNILNADLRGKKVWITEFGWNNCQANIGLTKQKEFVEQGFQVAASKYPQIEGMAIWNFGFGKFNQGDFGCYDIEGASDAGPAISGKDNPSTKVLDQPLIRVATINGGITIEYFGKKQIENCPSPNPAPAGQGGSNTKVTAKSWDNDSQITQTLSKTLLPGEVYDSINAEAAQQSKTKTGIEEDFFSKVAQAVCSVTTLFCQPNVEIGGNSNGVANTESLALRSRALALAKTPAMDYIPAQNDCAIYDLVDNSNTKGNQDINETQTFRDAVNNADKPLLADHEARVNACLDKLNLTIGSKMTPEDRRVCEAEINAQEKTQGDFPEGVDPYPNDSFTQSVVGR